MVTLCPHTEQGHTLLTRLGEAAGQDLARFLLHHPAALRTSAQIRGELVSYWRRDTKLWTFCRCDAASGEPVALASYRSAYLAALAASGLEVGA